VGSRPDKHRLPRVSPAGAGALVCAVLLVVTGYVALSGARVRAADETVLRGFRALDLSWSDRPLSAIAHLADPGPYILVGAVLVLLAISRGRPERAVAVVVLLIGSAVTSQLLKNGLSQPRLVDWLGAFQIGNASWPSGHATASMALALSGVLVSRPGHRLRAALVGGAFAAAVATAILALAWHFPSDVLGGFLVAATWALALVAALEVRDPAHRLVTWQALRLPAAIFGGAVAACSLAAGVALVLRSAGAVDSLERPAKLAGALIIAAAAAALPLAMSRAVDR
jgi:membrane-associated phospholipid phosphatase